MSTRFKKKVENFICEKCGFEVVGDGYTNHCPKCLWSKHVDIFPGDRFEKCGGMMEPIRIEKGRGGGFGSESFVITHKCVECGVEKRNKVCKSDDFNEVIKLS